ncbi:MAG: beta-ketoacyl-[acyl-carrier-protein] synthase family protein [Myxococcota bacterium]|nr:beta-ketoacyl-[acyl-carrier-protein] synthase family protein [Myxococcota bacterium]
MTGVGVVSAAGIGLTALSEALRRGVCCDRPSNSALPLRSVAAVPVPIASHEDFPDDRKAWLALTALDEAMSDAGLPRQGTRRRAVFLGTGLSSITPAELAEDLYPHLTEAGFDRAAMGRDLSPDRAGPRRHLPGRVTDYIANMLGARGPRGTNFSACAAAAMAIAEGARTLRRGEADVAIVGGHDSMIHPMGVLSFVVLGALAEDACRPFDKDRHGFLIGEGAAILILERAADAQQRGATIRANLLGAGTSVDAWNITAPHPDGAGAELSMRRALVDAGLSPSDIDYVNAHGTGTPVGDVAEARAIQRVLGTVPVSSIKGAVGHTIAAAGAVEAAACIAALQGGWMPGTTGLLSRDPACPITTLTEPVSQPARVMLSNSFGFGGQNCTLLLGRHTP